MKWVMVTEERGPYGRVWAGKLGKITVALVEQTDENRYDVTIDLPKDATHWSNAGRESSFGDGEDSSRKTLDGAKTHAERIVAKWFKAAKLTYWREEEITHA